MTRQELVRAVSEQTGLTRTDAAAAVEAFIEVMKKALLQGETVTLRNFGTFRLKYQRPRKGRIIRTGKEIQIPARVRLSFQPARHLSEKVAGNPSLLKRFAKE
ncbi:MAG: HU family DNA-binding protein [Bacteroidia bacterium]|jgi:nucleoid DNA-binding protein|nr:HU family DNA-binding protein [Bacteroidia bacterium]GIV23102.1 MAG: transcriptional regulator [Bacteroidia bacterium]